MSKANNYFQMARTKFQRMGGTRIPNSYLINVLEPFNEEITENIKHGHQQKHCELLPGFES